VVALSVGIGLTSDCNLHCAHCYRPSDRVYALSLEDVKVVCEHLPVASIGLGTGENGLHPQFREIITYLRAKGIQLSMASNGYSLNRLSDEHLAFFHDAELSIDFPTESEQDAFRGQGNWAEVHSAIARCKNLGIETSILATMMNTNYQRMDQLVGLARSQGANLRVNVYQPVHNGRFTLSYDEFWEGFRRLLSSSRLVSCTEPVVSAVLGNDVLPTCAHQSVRITPQRFVTPCVYWPNGSLTIEDLRRLGEGILDTPLFQDVRQVPPSAAECPCHGGCAGRRALLGDLDQHDIYCPWIRGDAIHLDYEMAPAKDLVRKRNYCTTIVM
jgi:MoaA/NifB/PqqE/SkfB family radical SAM enzyme